MKHSNIKEQNEQYSVDYNSFESYIHINHLRVEYEHRNKGIASKVISDIQNKYKLPIFLICYETLLPFYKKINFGIDEIEEDDYFLMKRDYTG